MLLTILIAALAACALSATALALLIGQRVKQKKSGNEALTQCVRDTETALKAHVETVSRVQTEALLQAVRGISEGNQTALANWSGITQTALDGMRRQLGEGLEGMRRQLGEDLEKMRRLLSENLTQLRAEQDKALGAMRSEYDDQMSKMRGIVDEKLQKTLNDRLTQSFNMISERLEAVQKGLGEMRELSGGVNDLKRVLTNVKTRGTWGETSLETLLADILTPDQYTRNAAVSGRASAERVDFAVRLPADGEELLLPIDVKFPTESYQRLMEADTKEGAAEAQKELIAALKRQARSIRDKYIKPPKTTDFAILYLPMEGLYAEVLREPGLVEQLQNQLKIVPAGPTTIAALLNSLRMGFRSLAIQRSSREIFDLVRRAAKEFDGFFDAIERTRSYVTHAGEALDTVSVRSGKLRESLHKVDRIAPGDAPPPDEA